VCVTGVSGSGKTTLVREVLWPALCGKLQQEENNSAVSTANDADNSGEEAESESAGKPEVTLKGFESLGGVVMVDQSPLGRTPRSNPAVYIGAFTDLRKLLASSQAARELGLDAGAFSFNSPRGQCPRCRGAGFEKIEMQFLSDVFVSCPDCQGRRYKREILQVTIRPPGSSDRGWNVARLLDATVDEALDFLAGFPEEPPAQHAAARLRLLQETGLGYLRLGQPLNTLSGGESQRLKLVGRLVEFASHSGRAKPFLFIFDEPTTGLHFDDIRVLLQVFQRLVNEGHSLLVIEHNLELIKCADWVIDLGPEAGEGGGRLVACGAPEQIMACQESHTGAALREVMQSPAKQSSAAASKQLN
jgi:excinuclease ABC subunit A